MTTHCPTCGQRILLPHGAQLSGLALQAVGALISAGEEGLTCDELVQALYGSRSDGGPLYASQVWHQLKIEVNRMMCPRGYEVSSAGWRHRTRYVLRRACPPLGEDRRR